uniref:Uncharacterized protein n=1 Tax=Romanomermis culicivorax TaxID=13658 RepID=A0A915K9P7_ROMCU
MLSPGYTHCAGLGCATPLSITENCCAGLRHSHSGEHKAVKIFGSARTYVGYCRSKCGKF